MTNISEGWISTYTGHKFYPLAPKPEDVHIEDIAHALSQVCRYGGHTSRFYSVAEHSVLVCDAVRRMDPDNDAHALQALLHDAAEAYLCDVPRPVKHNIVGYEAAEKAVEWAIGVKFGILIAKTWQISECDNKILYNEALELMTGPVLRARVGVDGIKMETVDNWHLRWAPGLEGVEVKGLRPEQAEIEFLGLFHTLMSRWKHE